jgi:hypothetical protein
MYGFSERERKRDRYIVVVEFAPLLVCRADQCIGPDPEFGDSTIPAGNCGPVSSDIHMKVSTYRHLYKMEILKHK